MFSGTTVKLPASGTFASMFNPCKFAMIFILLYNVSDG
jgi:hypothetical protein